MVYHLVLNPGSSSLKFALFEVNTQSPNCYCQGIIERIGKAQESVTIKLSDNTIIKEATETKTHGVAVEKIFEILTDRLSLNLNQIIAIGCRVVHGGIYFHAPTKVDDSVLAKIEELGAIAPLHNPLAVEVIKSCRRNFQNLPSQPPIFAFFDTAFHRTIPNVASTYALPHTLTQTYNLYKYGFHGIAHQQVSEKLLELITPKTINKQNNSEIKVITCHLGNGASVCAIKNGVSIETSMGFTPLAGLVMGTRCGDLDPGIILYLINQVGMKASEIDQLLNRESGLKGLSGISEDVRELEHLAKNGDVNARLALEIFAYRVVKYIGSYVAILAGLDALAFSGGIGENSVFCRELICNRLQYFGIKLSTRKNRSVKKQLPQIITASNSKVPVWVIHADEELKIAELLRVI